MGSSDGTGYVGYVNDDGHSAHEIVVPVSLRIEDIEPEVEIKLRSFRTIELSLVSRSRKRKRPRREGQSAPTPRGE